MRPLFIMLLVPLMLSACTSQPKELKSPCVGAEGSPCGKRPANADLV